MSDIKEQMKLQSNEFNALETLIQRYKNLPAVVDDDYPEMRHHYESAMRTFLEAVSHNRGRNVPTLPIQVEGSRANIQPHQSIPHISVISFARALRWHPNGLESWSSSDWAVAVVGEAGEMCNVIKKMNRIRDGMQQRGNDGQPITQQQLTNQLKMEIGDVYIYLDLIARRHGLNLEDCIRDTFNRISIREGFPERL